MAACSWTSTRQLPRPSTVVSSGLTTTSLSCLTTKSSKSNLQQGLRSQMWPFGALLLTPFASSRRGAGYKRVAAGSLITVRFREDASLVDILNNVRVVTRVRGIRFDRWAKSTCSC
ncbi:hypothetical protein L210DRAFT_941332 [Boletus edulis BED1]|uniref:Uncharacterized protein n=1 Tax=Boletus edulis BED1 TaxID=1328754 RepID=A0AAD4BF26_BOLED|nr:hypothetical protein L210DRAFT_941332 [Boletus edulis BED1]